MNKHFQSSEIHSFNDQIPSLPSLVELSDDDLACVAAGVDGTNCGTNCGVNCGVNAAV